MIKVLLSVSIFLASNVLALTPQDFDQIKWRTLKIWDKKTNIEGTGILLDKTKGLVLTNRHVCNGLGSEIEAQFYNQVTVELLSRKQFPTNSTVDLCILNIKTLIPSKIPMQVPEEKIGVANFNAVIGETVIYSGYPLRYYITVRSGVVFEDFEYRNKGDVHNRNAQYVDAVTGSGGSGSGVYDTHGNLVGVIFAYVMSPEEIKSNKASGEGAPAVMVPLKDLKIFLEEVGFFK